MKGLIYDANLTRLGRFRHDTAGFNWQFNHLAITLITTNLISIYILPRWPYPLPATFDQIQNNPQLPPKLFLTRNKNEGKTPQTHKSFTPNNSLKNKERTIFLWKEIKNDLKKHENKAGKRESKRKWFKVNLKTHDFKVLQLISMRKYPSLNVHLGKALCRVRSKSDRRRRNAIYNVALRQRY